jgi:hypothetical protein
MESVHVVPEPIVAMLKDEERTDFLSLFCFQAMYLPPLLVSAYVHIPPDDAIFAA